MQQTLQALDGTFAQFMGFLPNLFSATIVLIIGWIVAIILGRITNALLERVGFNRLVQHGQLPETMQEQSAKFEPSKIVGTIVFWTALITTFLLSADILGLTAVSVLLSSLVSFLPLVAVAVIALVVAVALGQVAYDAILALLGERVEGSVAIASAAKWGIIAFGVFIALSQLQIAPVIVNGLFLALVGSIALAFGVSFGWGNIDLAQEITAKWYHRTTGQAEEHQAKKREDHDERHAA